MKRRKQKVYVRRKIYLQHKKRVLWLISRLVFLSFLLASIVFLSKKIYTYFLHLPMLQIRQIEIDSDDNELVKRVKLFLPIKVGDNIFFRVSRIKKGILSVFPEIKEISIKRQIVRGGVLFSLTSRQPLAQIIEGDSVKGVDKEGKIFPLFSRYEVQLPEICNSTNNLVQMMSFLDWLKNGHLLVFQKIRKVFTEENGNLVLMLNDGTKISWGDLNFNEEKLHNLGTVLNDLVKRNKKISSADLNFYPEGGIIVTLQ